MTNPESNWNPCPAGELVGLSSTLRGKRRLVLARRAVLSSTVGLILVVGAYFGVQGSLAPAQDFGPLGGIGCRDCVDSYDDYAAGQLASEMEARMSAHLDDCPSCKRYLEPNGRRGSTRIDRPELTQVSLVASAAFALP